MTSTGWAIVIIILVVLVGGGAWWYTAQQPAPDININVEQNATTTGSGSGVQVDGGISGTVEQGSGVEDGPAGGAALTMAVVATHNSAASCWSVIDGGVYDLTNWAPSHPGGKEAILKLCGKDGSALFHGQHGSNQQQASVLAKFKIGVLAQ